MLKSKVGLLVAAATAYGIYRYSKMSAEQKKELMTKGRDFVDKNFGSLGNVFGKKKQPVNGTTM
jgi:hypothetical protein